jgi:carbamoyl-phosphate synthase large subunit
VSDRPTVLVLGAGGNVSQGIQKALGMAPTPWRVVAACVSPEAAGLHVAERALISPLAADPGFLDWVVDTCRAEEAVAVLSGVEPVLDRLAAGRDRLLAETGAVAVVADPQTLAIGADKLRTATWLAGEGLAAPASAAADDAAALERLVQQAGFPLFAKPRFGRGGAGLLVLDDRAALARVCGRPDILVQELLGSADEEFTVGLVCSREGELAGSIAFRRHLEAGTTVVAQAGDFPEVRAAAETIAARLRPCGPLNVQLRLRDGEPVAFELNIRFSGTTPMRARMGFHDVDAVVRHLALGEPMRPVAATRALTAVRYFNEIYLDDGALGELDAGRPVDGPSGFVEPWGMRP